MKATVDRTTGSGETWVTTIAMPVVRKPAATRRYAVPQKYEFDHWRQMTEMQPDDRWYFAYGSNLDIDQKRLRTGTIRCARQARLLNYRFAFSKRGSNGNFYANIVPERNAIVRGVIYLCCPDAIDEMDGNEGVSGGHYRHHSVVVTLDDGSEVTALTYVAGDDFTQVGRPKDEYLQKILRGARHHGLPTEYIEQIETIARSSVDD